MQNSLIQMLAALWVDQFKLKPVVTSAVTVLAAACGVAVSLYADYNRGYNQEAMRLSSSTYQAQVSQLSETERNIRQLLSFIESQKISLRETEDNISKLKSEQETLQPLVSSNREIVDALFRAQEERTKSGIWTERLIGFGFGIVASLIASFIWFVGQYLIRGRQPNLDRK